MLYLKNYCESVFKLWEQKTNQSSKTIENGALPTKRLTLYYHYYSFYSQKVLMALHEKQVDFEGVVVDITRGEQHSAWFLHMNPRGEVPVLRDSGRCVPDSTRILDHLEKKAHDPHPLVNVSSDEKLVKTVEKFRDLLDAMPAGVITMGSFYHPDLCGQPKLPFIHSVRNTLRSAESNNSSNLRKLAEQHPTAKATLLYKAEIHERKHRLLADRQEYVKVLDQVESLLELVEAQLASQPSEWWLCCENFTLADISLTVLLERLYILGLEGRFWLNGRRPHIENYYSRVRERDCYKAAVPSVLFHLKIMLLSQPPRAKALISIGSLSAVIASLYVFKKIMF